MKNSDFSDIILARSYIECDFQEIRESVNTKKSGGHLYEEISYYCIASATAITELNCYSCC